MTNPIDIRPEHLAIVKQILADTLPPESKCWAFGSRAKWTAKDSSDLDLAIDAGKALTKQQSFTLSDALEESDLPYKVDVVDLHNVSESFREVIERDKVPLREDGVKAGTVAAEWEYLDDLCEAIVDCPHSTPKWTNEGYIVLRNQNIRNGRLDLTTPSYTDAENFAHRTKRAKLKAGDIVFTREAPMGEVCLIPEGLECCLGQRQVLLRASKAIDSKYLFYAMQSEFVRHQVLWNEGTGSVVSNVRIPLIKKLKIPRFAKEYEQYIANTLSALDDKMELNRRMNATLEAMARALFKSWFVDFDPVRAKMESRAPEGLSAEIAALFPDTLIDSPLGEIPKGWEAGSLGALATNKKQTVRPDNISEGASYIALEHMPQKSIALSDWGSSDNIASAKSEFSKGDFLFGKLRPYFHKVGIAPLGGVCSTDIVVIAPKFIEAYSYVICCISQNEYVDYTNQRSAGTKMPRTNWKDMAAYELAIPPKALLKAFNEICRPSFDKIIENIHEVRTLSQLRDTLLPKLISGHLRVTDNASSIKEAV